MRCVNEGHARLRKHLPQELKDKRLSKVESLRVAIYYINVEPAGLVSGWRCRLETRVTAPLQQRSECSNDGEYSLKLAQPYKCATKSTQWETWRSDPKFRLAVVNAVLT